MFEFKYTLTEKDYYDYNKCHLLTSKQGKRVLLFTRLLVPLFAFIMFLNAWLDDRGTDTLIAGIIFFALVSVCWFFLARLILVASIRITMAAVKKGGKPPYGRECIIRFEQDCIFDKTGDIETKLIYGGIDRVTVGASAVYVYFNTVQALVLPLRCFENEAQKHDFLFYIDEKIANKT